MTETHERQYLSIRSVLLAWAAPQVILLFIVGVASPWVLDTDGFVARAVCGAGFKDRPALVSLFVFENFVFWVGYQILPLCLIVWRFTSGREVKLKVSFATMFLWAGFIEMCGHTHLLDALMFAWPAYKLSALVWGIGAIFTAAAVMNVASIFRVKLRVGAGAAGLVFVVAAGLAAIVVRLAGRLG